MKTKKDFIYLIQGAIDNLIVYREFFKDNSDLLTLSYDEDYADGIVSWTGHIFFPNSTWAEGRNKLLECALNLPEKYLYYIFMDDDVVIKKGSIYKFESLLLQFMPAVGLPLCDQIKNTFRYDKRRSVQYPCALDQVMQAYHRDTIAEGIILPFVTKYDPQSWWYSCEINQFLILSYYGSKCLQFNTIEIENKNHCWVATSGQGNMTRYIGGIDATGMEEIRQYIKKKYGPQPNLPNSLFHNPRHPRLIYMESGAAYVDKLLALLRDGDLTAAARLTYKYIYKWYPYVFHYLFNRRNIIKQASVSFKNCSREV